MKYLKIAGTDLNASNIVMGCMRLAKKTKREAEAVFQTALEEGVNFFDHADIYRGGECEALFSQVAELSPSRREKMILQSKCGIGKGFYDFSRAHILESVEGILRRLGTDYLDVLLLHRPDALVEPEEVAAAFDELYTSGKVRYFGLSNHNAPQTELLQKYCRQKLVFAQLQFSLVHTPLLDNGIAVNMELAQSVDRTGGILDYCRLREITIQAWSPFQRGFFQGAFLGDQEHYPELNRLLNELAEQYNVTPAAVAVAWITRHPANMQVVLGTMDPRHFSAGCAGSGLPLTRPEWYALYQAAGNTLP